MQNVIAEIEQFLNGCHSLAEGKGGDDEGRKLWGMIKGDLEKSRDTTRMFIRKIEILEQQAANVRDAIKKMNAEQRKGGLSNVTTRKLNDSLKEWNKKLNELYGLFAEGRNSMSQVAKTMKVSTKTTGKPNSSKRKSKKIAASEMSRGKMMTDLNKYSRDLNKRIEGLAEVGSRASRVADGMLGRKSDWTESALRDDVGAWVRDMVDFKNKVSGVFYGAIRGIQKRADELSLRAGSRKMTKYGSRNASLMKKLKLVADFNAYLEAELPFLFEDEDFELCLDALVLNDDNAELWVEEANALIEGGYVPSEPKARAEKRMDDAAKRGGVSGLVKALQRRAKATKDADKLAGMAMALDELIADLQMVRRGVKA